MNKADYEKALAAAQQESEELVAQRTKIDRRLSELKATIDALSKLLGRAPTLAEVIRLTTEAPLDPGITNAVRRVLVLSKAPMSVNEIRLGVRGLGLDMSQYVNSSAVIHNTLSRLERQGEVIKVQGPSGQALFALIGAGRTLKEKIAAYTKTDGTMPSFEPKLGLPASLSVFEKGKNPKDK